MGESETDLRNLGCKLGHYNHGPLHRASETASGAAVAGNVFARQRRRLASPLDDEPSFQSSQLLPPSPWKPSLLITKLSEVKMNRPSSLIPVRIILSSHNDKVLFGAWLTHCSLRNWVLRKFRKKHR